MKKYKRKFGISFVLLSVFIIWTISVCFVDVQAIGPEGSSVGFASINRCVHDLTGVHFKLYTITDWLGLVPVGICMVFAILGLVQLIARKSLLKIDHDILILGIFYLVTIAAYLFFESFAINYRPVLINGFLEVSYPSSTTLLVLCVMPTAVLQFNNRIKNNILKKSLVFVISVFIIFMVVGRLISGVHWSTDIIGGALLSSSLVMMYSAFTNIK